MARRATSRHRTLTDREFLERIQSLLVNTAEGRRSIADDRQYVDLRKQFPARQMELPRLLATHPTVDSFDAFMKTIANRQDRKRRVLSEFAPLIEAASTDVSDPVDASAWTGRKSVGQQAAIVRSLGPVALEAIEALIFEQARRHDNGGPVEPQEEEAIERLRELRKAVDELIRLAEAGQPMVHQSKRLAKIAAGALSAFGRDLKEDARALPHAGSAASVAAVTFALSHLMLGLPETGALLVGGAAVTGLTAKRSK